MTGMPSCDALEQQVKELYKEVAKGKRAEKALRESERKFETLFQASPVYIAFSTLEDGRFLEVNNAFTKITGYDRKEVLGRTSLEIGLWAAPEERARFVELAERRGGFHEEEARFRRKNGELLFGIWSAEKIELDGKACLISVLLDVTERKRAEEALRISERRYRSLFTSTNDGVCLHEVVYENGKPVDYRILDLNPRYETITGVSRDRAIGALASELYGSGEAPYLEIYAKVSETGKTASFETYFEPMDKHLQISVFSPDLHKFATVFQDITERKRAEAEQKRLLNQLAQARKMESVGRLAGGVAHDFNNILTVILGYTDMALEEVDAAVPLHGRLLEIKKAGERSAAITRQLLAFARRQTIAPKVLDLNETIEGMLKMLRRLIGENIDLAWLPVTNVWSVRMDPSQVDQILANLCVNARDAISSVGKITIETDNVTFDEADCADKPDFIPGSFILLAVNDNGCGMDRLVLDNLFEPFFTTKEVNKGTGLGLATVYGIVKQNNGFINVYSEPGQGTTFRIYLPRYETAAEEPQKNHPLAPNARGSETILLVEDDPPILLMTEIILTRMGYTVLTAKTPGEAIRLAREHAGRLHLLITDVVMPEMNGRDLARNLLALHPNLKAMFMSGYTADVIAHHGILDDGVHFIQKPFSRQDLSAKVREVLEGE